MKIKLVIWNWIRVSIDNCFPICSVSWIEIDILVHVLCITYQHQFFWNWIWIYQWTSFSCNKTFILWTTHLSNSKDKTPKFSISSFKKKFISLWRHAQELFCFISNEMHLHALNDDNTKHEKKLNSKAIWSLFECRYFQCIPNHSIYWLKIIIFNDLYEVNQMACYHVTSTMKTKTDENIEFNCFKFKLWANRRF